MDRFFLSVKKRQILPIVCLLGFILWLPLCQAFHDSYWQGTIYRVQTVDFNMLHHTLPARLSQLIIADRADLIQKVLDSNFGLFGLVVTDPTGNSILYKTNKSSPNEPWQTNISPDDLADLPEPYDLLTDPPALEPLVEYADPHDEVATRKAPTPRTRVLGRVYYVRNTEPTLAEDLFSFLTTGFWQMNGAKRGYLFITTSTVELILVALLLVSLKRRSVALKQTEIEHVTRELAVGKRSLEHLANELTVQKARKVWLEKEAEQSYRRALELKQSLESLRDSISPALTVAQIFDLEPGQNDFRVRPPIHPPSSILEEIESIIPDLNRSAGTLKAQASMLHEYCAILEERHSEAEKFVKDTDAIAYVQGMDLRLESNSLDMQPER